jgi:CBS domain-containing protein
MNLGNLDETAFDFLRSNITGSLQRKDYALVTVNPSESAVNALKILAENNVSSAPVYDTKKFAITGTISTMDLAVWIVRTYAISKNIGTSDFDIGQLKMELNTPIREVMNWGLDPFWPVPDSESILNLINNFMKWRIHRTPIVGPDYHVTGSLSQSDVIRFLFKNRDKMQSVMKRSVEELGLMEGGVVAVVESEALIKAFSAIVETQYTGLAVIDSKGGLVSNISASDLRGLTMENFDRLNVPIHQFVSMKAKKELVTCRPKDTVETVMEKMVTNRVHRVYVVDDQGRPSNVITMTTIMRVFSTPSENIHQGGRLHASAIPMRC